MLSIVMYAVLVWIIPWVCHGTFGEGGFGELVMRLEHGDDAAGRRSCFAQNIQLVPTLNHAAHYTVQTSFLKMSLEMIMYLRTQLGILTYPVLAWHEKRIFEMVT